MLFITHSVLDCHWRDREAVAEILSVLGGSEFIVETFNMWMTLTLMNSHNHLQRFEMDNPMPSTALAELSQSAHNLKYLVARLPSYDQLYNIPAQDPAFAMTLEYLDIGHCSYDTGGWRWVFVSLCGRV